MMENRSFDHLLGWLSETNPKIDGLNNTLCNYVDTRDQNLGKFCVDKFAPDKSPEDPHHDIDSTTEQIFGARLGPGVVGIPEMSGFVQNAASSVSPGTPMSMFTKEDDSAPIINHLALNYAVIDQWHASLPGPTDPNRAFFMSGTSGGVTHNFGGDLWTQQSYFDFLTQHNVSWNAFYDHDLWAEFYFEDVHKPENIVKMFEIEHFFTNLENGKLADFTYLQPRMSTTERGPPNWQHPDASVREGERLIKRVYETLIRSPFWQESALLITYDEHGGFYDHVPPPQVNVPNPDGLISDGGFQFNRLGIRVPTVVVSPHVPKGLVVSNPKGPTSSSKFDHTSMMATANKFFGIEEHLTKRAAWAGTFEHIFSLTEPRRDCPLTLTDLPPWTKHDLLQQGTLPLNEHMQISIDFFCKFNNHDLSTCGKDITNQASASSFLTKERNIYLSKFH